MLLSGMNMITLRTAIRHNIGDSFYREIEQRKQKKKEIKSTKEKHKAQ